MRHLMSGVVVTAIMALVPLVAPASVITLDDDLTNGVLFGSGNANGFFVVGRENGIELGLRAKVRYPVPSNTFNSNGDGTYSHATGTYAPGERASWNYEFGADLDYLGGSGRGFTNTHVYISIDMDPSQGIDYSTFNIALYGDNEPAGHPTIQQNSQNLGFLPDPPYDYDFDADATYNFRLEARDATSGDLLAETWMQVIVGNGGADLDAVPEPATMSIWAMVAGIGLCVARRKRCTRS